MLLADHQYFRSQNILFRFLANYSVVATEKQIK